MPQDKIISFGDHPLRRLSDAHMIDDFRRENSAVACPNCKAALKLFTHKPTGWKAFFICEACCFFGANYCLEEIIERHNPHRRAEINASAITAALDREVTKITTDETTRRPNYARLSGGGRHAKRNN